LAGRTGGKLREAEPQNAKRRAEAMRRRAREIIGRPTRCTNDDDF
jgi:hypothetical protein